MRYSGTGCGQFLAVSPPLPLITMYHHTYLPFPEPPPLSVARGLVRCQFCGHYESHPIHTKIVKTHVTNPFPLLESEVIRHHTHLPYDDSHLGEWDG